MLREAARCGLNLDASGVALQAALQLPHGDHTLLSDNVLNTLSELRTRLDDQCGDASRVVDQWEETNALEDKLSQDDLANVVELCAKADSYPVGGDLSADAKRPLKQSLRGAWWILEVLPLQTRNYTPQGAKQQDILR